MFFDIAHQELDNKHRDQKRNDAADGKRHELDGCEVEAELEYLYKRQADHDRYGEEKGELRRRHS